MRKFYLAPMEGVMDFLFRDLITSLGGVEQATSEFIRVTDKLVPDEVFYRHAPELKMNSRTRSGTPFWVQLLGGQAEPLAKNAQRLSELGALGIDLNFGCPAKTVNRHDGGASLLKSPERIFDIVSAVRKATPDSTPVSVKMRLGFDSKELCFENAKAAEEGGAFRLTVHARLKTDGYRPPAYWDWIARIRERSRIPVVANGEIWNTLDLDRCAAESGCTEFMIGRGVLRNPFLIREFYERENNRSIPEATWQEKKNLVLPFFDANESAVSPFFAQSRTKQWLKQLSQGDREVTDVFDRVKTYTRPAEFRAALELALN